MSRSRDEFDPGRAALIAGVLIACHLALTAYFAPRGSLHSGRLVLNDAFALEAYRAFRARAAFESWGTFSAYDPTVLSGQLAGLVEGLGTRIFVLPVVFSSRLGLDPIAAFNGVIVAIHGAVPLVAYAAARAFRAGRGAALLTMASWTAIWFFDSVVHYAWFSGRMGWALSSGVAVLFIGVGSRVAGGAKPRWAIATILVGLAAVVLHPIPALFGTIILVGLALGRRGLLPWRRALLAGAAAVPVLVLSPFWGRGALRTSEPVQRLFDVGVGQVVWDFLEISSSGYRAPGATRTMLRVLTVAASVLGLLRLRASGDYRYAPLVAATAGGFGTAYFGGYLPIGWPVDPYFATVFAVFAATIPASFLITQIEWRSVLSSRLLRTVILVVAVVAIPRWVRTVATYIPELLPNRVVRSTIDFMISPLVGVKEPLPDRLRHEAAPPSFSVVAEWFAEHYGGRGSILVDDASLTAYLSASAMLPVLGPLGERGSPSAATDPSWIFSEPAETAAVERFLDDHAVGWIALWGAPSRFDADDALLEPTQSVAGVRVRRVRKEPSFFAEGAGRVPSLGLGRVRVVTAESDENRNAGEPRRVTLRFHYDRALSCRPNCRAVPEAPRAGDVAPFVSIERPPPEFELFWP